MLRRSGPPIAAAASSGSFFQVLREELGKIPALFKHDLKAAEAFLSGKDAKEAMTDKDKKVAEAYQDLLREEAEKERAHWRSLSFKEKASHLFHQAKHSVSTKSSVVALVQHCTRAHMAEVAVELGVDVKNINIVTERAAVGSETKVVGYIDAPAATGEEVMAYAAKMQQACPAAMMMGEEIEWRRQPGQGEPPRPQEQPLHYASEMPDQQQQQQQQQQVPVEPELKFGGESPLPQSRYQPGSSGGRFRADVRTKRGDADFSFGGRTSSGVGGGSSSFEDDEELSLPFTGMSKRPKGAAPLEELRPTEPHAEGVPAGMPSSTLRAAQKAHAPMDASSLGATPVEDKNLGGFGSMRGR